MWHSRKKIFTTSNPNYIVTAISSFPNINTSIEKYKEMYDIKRLQNDVVYRDLMAYYYIFHDGRDFIPLYFGDDNTKLARLDEKFPQGKSFFWCLGYVSKCLKGGGKSLFSGAKSLNTPDFNTLLSWLEYHIENYNKERYSSINANLASDCLRKWVNDHSQDKIEYSRKFKLIYNCSTVFDKRDDKTPKDWVNHIKNLKNRDFYEIIVNDFN